MYNVSYLYVHIYINNGITVPPNHSQWQVKTMESFLFVHCLYDISASQSMLYLDQSKHAGSTWPTCTVPLASGRREELQKEVREAQAKPPPKTQVQLVLCCKEAPVNTLKWREIVIPLTVGSCASPGVPQMLPGILEDGHVNLLMDNLMFCTKWWDSLKMFTCCVCVQECVFLSSSTWITKRANQKR